VEPEALSSFTSSHQRSVDPKGRFSLPYQFRRSAAAAGEESYVVAPGPMGALCLMTNAQWSRAFAHIRSQGWSEENVAQIREMSRQTHVTQPDKQGRIQVPPSLLRRYGIEDRVEILGLGHYMELWPAGAAKQAEEEKRTVLEEEFLRTLYE
jgi:DNA-binding transcriptional regulator/RsmH inhibitor MraZ